MASGYSPALSLSLRNILFATDFSPCSEAALPFARAIAARFGSTLHFVHVLRPEPHLEAPLDRAPELDLELQQAWENMERLLRRQSLQNIDHKALIERGPLWDVLQRAVQDRRIDLIVTATHGRRGVARVVLGSVAEEIFRSASCPVLTIGPHLPPNGLGEGVVGTVLYTTDFSPGSSQSLIWALELARQDHARLAMVHVLPEMPEIPPAELEEITCGVRHQLSQMLPRKGAPETDCVVLFGSAAHGILRAAEEQNARLIVMSVRAASGRPAASHIPWATAYRVVCEAKCPVLTLRRAPQFAFGVDSRFSEEQEEAA